MKLETKLPVPDKGARKVIESNFEQIQADSDQANDRLTKLENTRVTHAELERVRKEWHDRASHIARGTDVPTTRAVVVSILKSLSGETDPGHMKDDDLLTRQDLDDFTSDDPDLYNWLKQYVGGV